MCRSYRCRVHGAAVLVVVLLAGVVHGEEVEVFSSHAEVREGDTVLLRPSFGQKLRLLKTQRDWAQVSFQQQGAARKGWIKLAHLLRDDTLTAAQSTRLNAAFADQQAGQSAVEMGDFDTFLKLGTRALDGYRAVLGAGHVHVALVADALATVLRQQHEYDRAEPLYREAAEIYKAVLGTKHPIYAIQIDRLGMLYQDTGDTAKAAGLHEEALRITRETLGKDNSRYGACLNNLAAAYRTLGKFQQAEPMMRECLDLTIAMVGERHEHTVVCLHNLASLYSRMGDYPQALPLRKRVVELRRQTAPENDPVIVSSTLELADLHLLMGQPKPAGDLYRQAADSSRAARGENTPEYAGCLTSLAGWHASQREFTEAERLYRQAIAIRRSVQGDGHPAHATALIALARHFADRGDFPQARPLYEQALRIREATHGKGHPEYADVLVLLGFVHWKTGDNAGARVIYQQALAIYEAARGADHPDCADALNALAVIHHEEADYARAETLYRKSLEISRASLGDAHPYVARALANLASLLKQTKEPQQALPLLQDALAIRKKLYGEQSSVYADTLVTLAALTHDLGDVVRTEELLRQASSIMLATEGEHNPEYGFCLENLAIAQSCQGKWAEAAANVSIARRLVRRHSMRVLPGLAEREQGYYLQSWYSTRLSCALSMSGARPDDARLAADSAEWLVNSQGIAHESLAARALLARESAHPAVAQAARRLQGVREELASLTLFGESGDQQGDAERRRQLTELSEQELELSRQLGQETGEASSRETWTDLTAIRARLPVDGVLIQIARFRQSDFVTRLMGVEHYAAWIIPAAGAGDVSFVDLGVANGIDQAIMALRQALVQTARGRDARGEPAATTELAGPLRALARLALDPLIERIGPARKIFLSPDSNLWLVPWGALALDDGRFSIEEYQFQFVTSGRDLLRGGPIVTQPSSPMIVADPDYSLAPEQVANRSKPPSQAEGDATRGAQLGQRRLPVDWIRLEGTLTEARLITPLIERYTGLAPDLCIHADAVESAVKRIERPRVLVLSTHGFFLPEQAYQSTGELELTASDARGGNSGIAAGDPWENPLLRCGLVLAGANTREHRQDISADDGILTGLEIVGMDLRGTELVVLSACETGLGEVRNGEGVAGLRQAFQLAGAEAVVASLWNIPDADTAIIIGDFFANLADGQSKAEALRNAQLKRIAARRERAGAAHPLFWAAFTLTGD